MSSRGSITVFACFRSGRTAWRRTANAKGERPSGGGASESEVAHASADWRPLASGFRTAAARERSFAEWLPGFDVPSFVAAGFFSAGADSTVKCFSCGGALVGWTGREDPWMALAFWFSHCSHVLSVRGQSWVDSVLSEGASETWDVEANVLPVSIFSPFGNGEVGPMLVAGRIHLRT